LLAACQGADTLQPRKMDDALAADFERVGAARVYFGHQSVGANVLSGLADLQKQLDRPVIRVAELGDLGTAEGQGVMLQTAIGKNGQPDAKCEDFRQVMRQLQGRVDAALFKFCYIDFDDQSDAAAIFDTYARTMDEMKRLYPEVVFIHVTSPLRSIERGPGVWARELLGKRNRASTPMRHAANSTACFANAMPRTRSSTWRPSCPPIRTGNARRSRWTARPTRAWCRPTHTTAGT